MDAFYEPTEVVTQTGDLNAIPWTNVEGKREFSLQLGLAIGDDDLTFQDPVLMDPVADRLRVASAPETFKERRNIPRPLPTPEVIEGDGGHADWGLWTEAVKKIDEGVSFAEPVPMRLGPK
jgi:hypothetical protein